MGQLCKVAGWGKINGDKKPLLLNEVTVPIQDLNTCAKNYQRTYQRPKVTNNTICAGLPGKDACFVIKIYQIR